MFQSYFFILRSHQVGYIMLIKLSAQHDIGGFSTTSALLSLKIELMSLAFDMSRMIFLFPNSKDME